MLNHQHILTLYYVFSDCKKKYIALEYGEQTLLQKLQENLATLHYNMDNFQSCEEVIA